MKRRWKETAGFTLVELIVVIAILGILAGVAVPVYSGYVKKANLAADQTLVDSINTAFVSACIENQVEINKLEYTPVLKIDDSTGVLNVDESTMEADVKAAFGRYLGGEIKFKVVKNGEVQFLKTSNRFEITDLGVYANLPKFAQPLIDAVKASNFFNAPGLGVSNLLDKVNSIGIQAASYAGTPGSGAAQMLGEYQDELMADLGFTKNLGEMSEAERNACMAAIEKMNLEKQAILATQVEGWDMLDPETKKALAGNAILSGYAVLDAAKGMNGKTVDQVLADIQGESNFKTLILNSTNENGVATASAAFGLYTAYAYSLPEGDARDAAIAKTQSPSTLLETMMSDTGFTTYLNDPNSSAETDLAGYLAAMQMIDASSTDKDAVRSLVVNGFTDPALLAAIQQQVK